MCRCTYIHTYICIYIHIYIYTCISIYVYMCIELIAWANAYLDQVSDYKDEIDRLNRELSEVKKSLGVEAVLPF